jgi:hypothetical protein
MGQVDKRRCPKNNCRVQAPARPWELGFLIAGLCSGLDAASKWDYFDDWASISLKRSGVGVEGGKGKA